MTTFTALVADDEQAPREQLRAALARTWPELCIVADVASGTDAWDAYLEHEPSVSFLDVRMPGLSGIDVARRIAAAAEHGPGSRVVLVTAYGDQALAAYDAGVLDYVLKPVEDERLARTVARLQAHGAGRLHQDDDARRRDALELLAAELRRPPPVEMLQAGVGKEIRLIPVEDVDYFEADSRYTRVVHAGGEALIRTPLKELLAMLSPSRFWQIHRSTIVNPRAVASAIRLDDGTMVVALRTRPERLAVSRPFQHLFKGQ